MWGAKSGRRQARAERRVQLRIDPVETPDATICLWDTKSTGVGMLPPPCDRDRFSDRGDLWGFHSRRIKTPGKA